MKNENILRCFIVASATLQILMYVFPFYLVYPSQDFTKLMQLDGYSSIVASDNQFIDYVSLFISLISLYGLLFLKNWARYLYLIFWIFSLITTLLFGVRVSLPLHGFFGTLIGVLDGAVITMIFFTELKYSFK